MNVRTICEQHYARCALAILLIGAFNLGFRIDRQVVAEWDESLYATTAWEVVTTNQWIGTTFQGTVDYYNTKPPLNVWLIALSFKAFGASLLSLRLPSIIAAWLTIVLLQAWTRRMFGATAALMASLVLSTAFGFLYIHAGRSGNADALLTLLILLTVCILWGAIARPALLIWLGPALAAVFLLKGMTVLMPAAIIALARGRTWRLARDPANRYLLVACALFMIPVGAWATLRWQFDGRKFFDGLIGVDFASRISQSLDGHSGTWIYYFDVLQKYQYEWLAVLVLAAALFPHWWHRVRPTNAHARESLLLIGIWAGATFLIPTLMATKLAWYLHPFLPVFALLVALVTASAGSIPDASRLRQRFLLAIVVLAVVVAESKLLIYSYKNRDLTYSVQGLLLSDKEAFVHRRVFKAEWNHADRFVAEALAGARPRTLTSIREFAKHSDLGDYLLLPATDKPPGGVVRVSSNARWRLYMRIGPVRDDTAAAQHRRVVSSPAA